MHFKAILIAAVTLPASFARGQTRPPNAPPTAVIAFVSDTQQPMWVEKLFLHSNQNTRATAMIFSDLLQQRPRDLYMLGDVVSLGYKDSKWVTVDRFLDSCKSSGIRAHGLLGNHDVMFETKEGERKFQKRFPEQVRTGWLSTVDSIAIVLLNSNFSTLSDGDLSVQQHWYDSTMTALDADPGIRQIIVTCHHAPYSNSKVVGSSTPVQEHFLPAFDNSKKANLFITGHAHAFEYFKMKGKNFLVIGGGGGLHQPLDTSGHRLPDLAPDYKPMFHYLEIEVYPDRLHVISRSLNSDFTGFTDRFLFDIEML